MAEMKYYIRYGNWRPEYLQSAEARDKAMEEGSKVVEKAGLKILFYGSSLGVSENSVCVYEGSPDSFLKMPLGQAPYTDSRINVVMTF
jgi:hypothetical protein